MRSALSLVACVLVLACTTQVRTEGPDPSISPGASTTPAVDVSDPDTSVFGLPLLTVDEASGLLVGGKLDGRVAAIFGWWIEGMPMSCPYTPFAPVLSTRCQTRAFADQHLQLGTYSESATGSSYTWSGCGGPTPCLTPATMAETSLGIWPGAPAQITAEDPTPGQRVVLVGHASDPRLWQCRIEDRQDCGDIFVVDRIAWVEGQDAPLRPGFLGDIQPTLTVDEAMTAAAADPGLVLNAIAVRGEDAHEIDPRLAGLDARIVWIIRVAGAPNEFGTANATNLVVDDANSTLIAELDLAVAADYAPALLTIQVEDERTPSGGDWGYTNYSIKNPAGRLIHGSSAAVALEPGVYTLRGNITGDITPPPSGPPCVTQLELEAGQDVWMKVTFAQDGSCSWAGTPPLS